MKNNGEKKEIFHVAAFLVYPPRETVECVVDKPAETSFARRLAIETEGLGSITGWGWGC